MITWKLRKKVSSPKPNSLHKFRKQILSTDLDYTHSHTRSLTVAAMDTTSSGLSRILWLLANHQDVQDKLRFEIREAQKKKTGSTDLLYDELVNLPYLDAICRESLRL